MMMMYNRLFCHINNYIWKKKYIVGLNQFQFVQLIASFNALVFLLTGE